MTWLLDVECDCNIIPIFANQQWDYGRMWCEDCMTRYDDDKFSPYKVERLTDTAKLDDPHYVMKLAYEGQALATEANRLRRELDKQQVPVVYWPTWTTVLTGMRSLKRTLSGLGRKTEARDTPGAKSAPDSDNESCTLADVSK